MTIINNPNKPESLTPTCPVDPKNILGSGELHPGMQKEVKQLLNNAQEAGLNVMLQQGHRSEAEQAKLSPDVTSAKPGQSYHQYGLAVDVVFTDAHCHPSWSENHDWQALGKAGKEAGLKWGGDWKGKKDRPHFQHPTEQNISTIQKIFKASGMQKLWSMIK